MSLRASHNLTFIVIPQMDVFVNCATDTIAGHGAQAMSLMCYLCTLLCPQATALLRASRDCLLRWQQMQSGFNAA